MKVLKSSDKNLTFIFTDFISKRIVRKLSEKFPKNWTWVAGHIKTNQTIPLPEFSPKMTSENRGQPIPQSSKSHHWWHNPGQTEVSNNSPPAHSIYPNSLSERSWWGSSPMSTSPGSQTPYSTSPDPKTAIPTTEGWNKWRRDSLKNFYHLDDFATPE